MCGCLMSDFRISRFLISRFLIWIADDADFGWISQIAAEGLITNVDV